MCDAFNRHPFQITWDRFLIVNNEDFISLQDEAIINQEEDPLRESRKKNKIMDKASTIHKKKMGTHNKIEVDEVRK